MEKIVPLSNLNITDACMEMSQTSMNFHEFIDLLQTRAILKDNTFTLALN